MEMHLSTGLKIRNMTVEDLPLIAEWASEAFTKKDIGLRWTPEKMLHHLRADFQGEHSFVVLDQTGVIGGIMAYPCTYDRGNELFLHTIVMRKDQQNKGVGKAFLQWFIAYAKDQKMTGIRLDAHVKLPSYNWYSQFGFHPSGWEQKILELV